jgi:hypothetical protein
MQGVAFRQADGKVIVETFADDSAKVKGKKPAHLTCLVGSSMVLL